MSNTPNAPAKYDIRKNPVYQVDCLTQKKGKRFASTKRRVRWRFGFSNRDAIERGLTGTDCRGAEHEVVFVWSLTSGKQLILADGHEVHWAKSPKHKGKFEFTWNMNGNHEMKVVAHASLFSRRKNAENSDQFDLLIDGLSFWNMPKMFELGTKRSALSENVISTNKMSPTSSMDMSAFHIQHQQHQQQQQQQMKQAPNKQSEFAWNDNNTPNTTGTTPSTTSYSFAWNDTPATPRNSVSTAHAVATPNGSRNGSPESSVRSAFDDLNLNPNVRQALEGLVDLDGDTSSVCSATSSLGGYESAGGSVAGSIHTPRVYHQPAQPSMLYMPPTMVPFQQQSHHGSMSSLNSFGSYHSNTAPPPAPPQQQQQQQHQGFRPLGSAPQYGSMTSLNSFGNASWR